MLQKGELPEIRYQEGNLTDVLIIPAIAEEAVSSQQHRDPSWSTPLHVDVFVIIAAPGCWNINARVKPCVSLGEFTGFHVTFQSQMAGSIYLLLHKDPDWPLGPGCST